METIHHLTQLLKNSGCDYRVFDLGRRISEIEPTTFSHIEQGKQPYPYPLQRTAHLAIAYWNADRQPWIWFLKFELDERGLLKQADIGRAQKPKQRKTRQPRRGAQNGAIDRQQRQKNTQGFIKSREKAVQNDLQNLDHRRDDRDLAQQAQECKEELVDQE